MHNLELRLKKSQLKDIWIMLGQSCNHRCRNCFEATEKGVDKNPNNLTDKQILSVINKAIKMGINEVGIPGSGEPFHPANIKTLFKIIDNNFRKKIHTTIFTHLGFFDEKLVKKLNKYGDKITLLAKFNSFKPEIQDWFDDVEGYTKKRKEVLDSLFKYHFNDGKRLGFVTSIMTINLEEIPRIFRFCRKNNIIIDIDNILPRGRGEKSPFSPSDKELRQMYDTLAKIDKKEFGNIWLPTCSYVGENACNRYCHHLFITKTGDVHPCIGSINVLLGNVKNKDLKEIWNSSEMKIIRARSYNGKCLKCKLFIKKKCNSCLGRYTKNLNNNNLLKTGRVHTIGCWGFCNK
jgi:MoaA/NifB/PqqE/SkfB family radical SAM enzyme